MAGFDPYDALVPVFLETDVSCRLEQIATAIFVEMDGEPFLFTAAHVTDDHTRGELLIPTSEGLSAVQGYMGYVDLPPEVPRATDFTDIAYYRLSSTFAQRVLHNFTPLPRERREIIPSALELTVCSASGYP